MARNYNLGITSLSVSFLAIVTCSDGKSATMWDAIKKEPMPIKMQEPPHTPTGSVIFISLIF